MAGGPHEGVFESLLPRASFGVQTRPLHEPRRYAKGVPKTGIFLLLRLSHRMGLSNTEIQVSIYMAELVSFTTALSRLRYHIYL